MIALHDAWTLIAFVAAALALWRTAHLQSALARLERRLTARPRPAESVLAAPVAAEGGGVPTAGGPASAGGSTIAALARVRRGRRAGAAARAARVVVAPSDHGADRVRTAAAPTSTTRSIRGPDLEAFVGRRVLVWVGATLVLLAGAFLVQQAWTAGWFGPRVRLAVGAAVGLSAWAIGGRIASSFRPLGSGLVALGSGLLLVVSWAATALYGYISPAVGCAAWLVTVTATIGHALRLDHRWLAAFGFGAGYASPLLVGEPSESPLGLLALLVVLGGACTALRWLRRWDVVFVVGAIGTFVAFSAWWVLNSGGQAVPWSTLAAASALLAVFLVGGSYTDSLRGEPIGRLGSLLVALGCGTWLIWTWVALVDVEPVCHALAILTVAGALMSFASGHVGRVPQDRIGLEVLQGVAWLFVFLAPLPCFDAWALPVTAVVQGLLALGSARRTGAAWTRRLALLAVGVGVVATVVERAQAAANGHFELGAEWTTAAIVAGLLVAGPRLLRLGTVIGDLAAAGLGWLVLGTFAAGFVVDGAVPDAAPWIAAAFVIACGILALNRRVDDPGSSHLRLAAGALWVVGGALFVVATVDRASAAPWAGGSTVAMLAIALLPGTTALALIHGRGVDGAGWRAFGVGVSLVATWLLATVEIGERAAVAWPATSGSARQIAWSVVWSVFASALLAAGLSGRRVRALRLAALGLFGVTVVKILAVDLAVLDAMGRATTSLVVGVALIGAAFAYARRIRPVPAAADASVRILDDSIPPCEGR